MLPNGRPLGAHLPLAAGLVRGADRAVEIGATAIQVFTDNPASWGRRASLPDELPAFRERLDAGGIALLSVHAPYLVNLAAPDDAVRERSIELLAHELRVAAAYGAAFVNVHAGSHRGAGTAAGIERVADGLRRVLDLAGPASGDVAIVLENGSGAGFGLGSTVEELAAIDAGRSCRGSPTRTDGLLPRHGAPVGRGIRHRHRRRHRRPRSRRSTPPSGSTASA